MTRSVVNKDCKRYEAVIKLDALDVAVGETTRNITCPFCAARGDIKPGTFAVTRSDTGVLYHCWRASCEAKGFIPSSGYTLADRPDKTEFAPKYFQHPLRELPVKLRMWLKDMYNLTDEDIRANEIKYSYTENRLALPITTIDGWKAGIITKRLPEQFLTLDTDIERYNMGRKSIVYWESDAVRLDFPSNVTRRGYPDTVVLVEDKLSAIRLRQFGPAVSLCGSYLTDEMAGFLAVHYRHLIHATDADTWQNADKPSLGLRHYHQYGLFFQSFTVRHISKDPKDMTDLEIRQEIFGD